MATKEPTFFNDFMEQVYGFAQAVKVGDTIYVSGQTAFTEQGEVDGIGDMGAQMRRAYANILRVLERNGATADDIVDETLFVTDLMAAATVAHEVRKEVYGGRFEVASTLCQIQQLGTPDLLIEIKCTARV
jgi:enamine deaminase RidA (YjgF/YER057c/UK114 family)